MPFKRPSTYRELLGRASQASLEAVKLLQFGIETGEILAPQALPAAVHAGGTNYCPCSNLSYSKMAAEVAGTLPATAGDTNYEAWRWYRQFVGADVDTTAAGALKATGHSLYAANEGADTGTPQWNRVDGWAEIGSVDNKQLDIAIKLKTNDVRASKKWRVLFRCIALDSALVPANVEAYAGFWHETGAGQEWISGSDYTISHEVKGTPGAVNADYRVLAKTDSGLSILSAILNVPNVPDVLSSSDYVRLTYSAGSGSGFIEFDVYKLVAGIYYHVFTVRNTVDFSYNDTGSYIEIAQGWPSVSTSAPLALAQTRNFNPAPVGGAWSLHDLTIYVPPTYDFSQTVQQYLRIGLSNPTGVDRHLAIDEIWLSTTYNEYSPDVMQAFPDGTYPVPTIAPTSGNQGGGGGVFEPPGSGTGGGACVLEGMPVLTMEKGRKTWRQYSNVLRGHLLKGESRAPYEVLRKTGGMVSEYYVFKTANGITFKCSVDHQFFTDLETRKRIVAGNVEKGTRLACWVNGRNGMTSVISKRLVPSPAKVGTFILRDLSGMRNDGDGLYLAGISKGKDRALYSPNSKPRLGEL